GFAKQNSLFLGSRPSAVRIVEFNETVRLVPFLAYAAATVRVLRVKSISLHRSVNASLLSRSPQFVPTKINVRNGSVHSASSRSSSSGSRKRRRWHGSFKSFTFSTGLSPSNRRHSRQRLNRDLRTASSRFARTRAP